MACRFQPSRWPCSAIAVIGLTAAAHAQPARLDLRVIAQSGIPTAAPALPSGCVFDDPPGIAFLTVGQLRRFELQARLVDTDPLDGVIASGIVALDFSIISTRAGLWSRAALTNLEAAAVVDPPPFNAGADCSGVTTVRGLHGAFRAWDTPPAAPRNDDPRNGTFSPTALANIHTEPVDALSADRWVALYTFEFTLPLTSSGDVALAARVEPANGVPFIWVGSLGQVFFGSAWTSTGLLLRTPPGPLACCSRGDCYIALTPSACFTNDGDPAIGGVCQPGSCCAADFNGNGSTSIQDVFDFVDAYLSGNPLADINHDGVLSVQDVFAFIQSWFTPCG